MNGGQERIDCASSHQGYVSEVFNPFDWGGGGGSSSRFPRNRLFSCF